MNPTVEKLVQLFRRLSEHAQYTELLTSVETRIVEWRWATGPMLPQIPFDEIATGFKSPHWTEQPPKNGWLHGLDANERSVYARTGDRDQPYQKVREQFWLYEDTGFFWVGFDESAKKNLLAVTWYEVKASRWLSSWKLNAYGITETLLYWGDNRFEGYVNRYWRNPSSNDLNVAEEATLDPANVDGGMHYQYTFDAKGRLERVTEASAITPDQPHAVTYSRISRKGT